MPETFDGRKKLTRFTFLKAGLLLHTKEFPNFVWQKELKILGIPHFFLGTTSLHAPQCQDNV